VTVRTSRKVEQLELQLETEKKWRKNLELTEKMVGIALNALSLRMLTTFALFADCALFAWAMGAGTWQAIAVAVLFAFATWATLYLRPPERKEKRNEEGNVPQAHSHGAPPG
jgi:hypothetical protein